MEDLFDNLVSHPGLFIVGVCVMADVYPGMIVKVVKKLFPMAKRPINIGNVRERGSVQKSCPARPLPI